jgi:hypothetical protein
VGSPDPNGTWSLYIVDDVASAEAASLGSWTLDIGVSGAVVSTTTTLVSSSNPARTGEAVTLTATVTAPSTEPAFLFGFVTFRDGGTVLAADVPLDSAGVATFTTSALSEGDHVLVASYAGVVNPSLRSTGSLSQRVDNPTVVSGNTFSNTGALTLAATVSGVASAFPSRVEVSGLSGLITKVSLAVSGVSIDRPDDLELLLVAPGGQSFLVLTDAGGVAAPASGLSLVLDDTAASMLATDSGFGSGTFRPSSHGPSFMPAPAPAGPHPQPASQGSSTFAQVFNGVSPNGMWSLYAFDDVAGGGGLIAGGWSLTIETAPLPPVANPETVFRDKDRSVKVPISTLLSNDSDPGDAVVGFVGVSPISANGASVSVGGGWVAYEAVPGSNGDDSFTYTISNGTTTAEGTVTVRVERPVSPTLNLSITAAGGTNTLRIVGLPGRSYQVQSTGSITPPVVWSNLGPARVADGVGRITVLDTQSPPRFYRAIEP